MANLKLGLRMLLKTPFVTGVAIVSLALGVGANTAIFSLFNQLLLRPLPVVEPERLVNLAAPGPKPGSDSCNMAGRCAEVFSYPMFRDLRRDQEVFTDIVAHRMFDVALSHAGRTFTGRGEQISGSYFPTLGLVPSLGRLFGPEIDTPPGGHPVVVLSHDFWRTRLAADPGVIDDTLMVNGQSLTIVGVAPAGFRGTTLGVEPAIFAPIAMRRQLSPGFDAFEDRRNYWVYLFARLKPSVSIDQAAAGLQPLYRSLLASEAPLQKDMSPERLTQFLAKQIPLADGRRGQSSMDDQARAPLRLLFAVTGVVLLIACANIANLLLARAAARAPEMAVRLSIGASRRQLVAQLLTESCLLAFAGGVVGLLAARSTLALIGSLLPPAAGSTVQLTLDPAAVAFAFAVSLGAGIVFGLFPAFHSTRSELVTLLKAQAGQPSGARAAARFRTGLVMVQIALSTALLIGAGLFIRSLANVSRADLGIRTENVLTFRLAPVLNGYQPHQIRALYDRVETAARAQPGVTAASAAVVAVFAGDSWGNNVMVEGYEAGPDTDRNSRVNMIGTGYFHTMGIPLLAGRDFTDADVLEAPKVAIVNEAFARKFGLDRDVVGRRMARGGLDAKLDIEIVGLVRDARYDEVKRPVPPLFYVPYRQEENLRASVTFYARTASDPGSLLRATPTFVAQVDGQVSVDDIKTLPQQVRENVFLDRMIGVLSAAFALLATLLAAVGLYGVLAYTVAQRTREMGLRMALGADASRLRNMVLGQVGWMTLMAGSLGVVTAILLARVARSLLYEMEGADPLVVAGAILALGAVALAAGFVPAYRASRIDPMRALRYE
jgi:predicted permease